MADWINLAGFMRKRVGLDDKMLINLATNGQAGTPQTTIQWTDLYEMIP